MRMLPVELAVDSLASVAAAVDSDSVAFELRSSAISGGMLELDATGGSARGGAGGTGVIEAAGTTGAAAGTVAVVGAVEAAGVTTADETLDLGSSGESARN